MIHREVNRKRRGSHYPVNTDANSYIGNDSGCTMATDALGKPSVCLENCPFDKCVLEMTAKERGYLLTQIYPIS